MEHTVVERTYTIQRVEDEMGVSAHTLPYYEKIGLLHLVQRSEHGRRVFSEEDLGWIYWLKLLRESGMSIQMMKRYVEITRAKKELIVTWNTSRESDATPTWRSPR